MISSHLRLNSFESFNARAASPAKVAETFIPPEHFVKLAKRAHTLVVGPRGSGKTTLLKMLTPEALQAWDSPRAEVFRATIDFTGVFIPTDIMWSKQLESMTNRGHFSEEESALFLNASFTIAVFRGLTTALISRMHPRTQTGPGASYLSIEVDQETESAMVNELEDAWRVKVRVRSLAGLQAALGSSLSRIAELASSERMRSPDGRAQRLAELPELHRDMIGGITDALDRLAIFVPAIATERWALMFDELELAPASVRERLFAALRSVDERLLFKLCISPYSSELSLLQAAVSAMPGNDHDEISLSYGRKEEAEDFTRDLMRAVLVSKKWPTTDPAVALGQSDFTYDSASEEGTPDGVQKYHSGSRFMRLVRSLEADDRTFRAYLSGLGLRSEDLTNLSGNRRAQALRKVMPLVILRANYRASDKVFDATGRRTKSRKAPDTYRGFDTLSAMLEGNPRWIIGMMSTLTDQIAQDGLIPVSRQVREVARTLNRFRALLATIPSDWETARRRRGLLPLIDEIGSYFEERVIADDFNPDPPGTFTVDASASESLLRSIGSAVNVGALVYIPDPGGAAILSSLRGKRFRLTYLFYPQFSLPPRLQRPVALSAILSGALQRSMRDGQEVLPSMEV